jgi:hypothetical protein
VQALHVRALLEVLGCGARERILNSREGQRRRRGRAGEARRAGGRRAVRGAAATRVAARASASEAPRGSRPRRTRAPGRRALKTTTRVASRSAKATLSASRGGFSRGEAGARTDLLPVLPLVLRDGAAEDVILRCEGKGGRGQRSVSKRERSSDATKVEFDRRALHHRFKNAVFRTRDPVFGNAAVQASRAAERAPRARRRIARRVS